jgi:hypothetical protein
LNAETEPFAQITLHDLADFHALSLKLVRPALKVFRGSRLFALRDRRLYEIHDDGRRLPHMGKEIGEPSKVFAR